MEPQSLSLLYMSLNSHSKRITSAIPPPPISWKPNHPHPCFPHSTFHGASNRILKLPASEETSLKFAKNTETSLPFSKTMEKNIQSVLCEAGPTNLSHKYPFLSIQELYRKGFCPCHGVLMPLDLVRFKTSSLSFYNSQMKFLSFLSPAFCLFFFGSKWTHAQHCWREHFSSTISDFHRADNASSLWIAKSNTGNRALFLASHPLQENSVEFICSYIIKARTHHTWMYSPSWSSLPSPYLPSPMLHLSIRYSVTMQVPKWSIRTICKSVPTLVNYSPCL